MPTCQLVAISVTKSECCPNNMSTFHLAHIGACSYLSSNMSTEMFEKIPPSSLTALPTFGEIIWSETWNCQCLIIKKSDSFSVLPLFGRLDFEQSAVWWLSRGFEPQPNASHLLCLQSYRHHLIHRDQHFCENMIGKTGSGLDLGFSFRGIWRHIS